MKSLYIPVVHGAALDRPDEHDTVVTAEAVAAALDRLGYATEIAALSPDLDGLEDITAHRPYVVFNLVEAIGGEAAAAVRALERMDRLGLAFTGAGRSAYATSNSKLTSKAVFKRHGLPTPDWWLATDPVQPEARVIVKSVEEHGSLGMDSDSVVGGRYAASEIARREARFGGRFFAEAFIEGREFNVSVLETADGPAVLPVAEIDFSGLDDGALQIVDFAAKWDDTAASFHATPRRFGLEAAEPRLAERIAALALSAWRAFDMRGYARVDFRVSASGDPTILEVNANPCLAPDAGFAAAAAEAGISYDELVARIVHSAACASRLAA